MINAVGILHGINCSVLLSRINYLFARRLFLIDKYGSANNVPPDILIGSSGIPFATIDGFANRQDRRRRLTPPPQMIELDQSEDDQDDDYEPPSTLISPAPVVEVVRDDGRGNSLGLTQEVPKSTQQLQMQEYTNSCRHIGYPLNQNGLLTRMKTHHYEQIGQQSELRMEYLELEKKLYSMQQQVQEQNEHHRQQMERMEQRLQIMVRHLTEV